MQKRYFQWIIVVLLLLVLTGCGTTLSEKFQKFLPGKEAKFSQLDLQLGSVYSGLPTNEFITQVWAWEDLPDCRLNVNSEINSIKNIYLQGKNEEWINQLSVWQDKLICMDTDTLLQVDTVLAKALQELAGLVRSASSIEAEFASCNSFNALLQPSWQVIDLTMSTGKSPLYQELQAAQDVGGKCNFYYPKVTFPLVAWNWETGRFDLFGLICEKDKENPSCWAAHDFFWSFALKPVNYGVGCTMSEWADTGFICARGVSFNSPGKLKEWKLKEEGDDLLNEDVTSSYVSKLRITGAEIVKNIENVCGLNTGSAGTIKPGLDTSISKGSIISNLGRKLGFGTSPSSSAGSKPAGLPSGPFGFQPTTGLEERLSALVLPLLPCAEGSNNQGWEELGNAMKGGCSVITGKGSDHFNEAEDKIAGAVSVAGGNACLEQFRLTELDQSPPILFSQRLTQHGISGPKSGCGEKEGLKDERNDEVEQSRKLDALKEAAAKVCWETLGCEEKLKSEPGMTYEKFKERYFKKITFNVIKNAEWKSFVEDNCKGGRGDPEACTIGGDIYIPESLASSTPNAPYGKTNVCNARITAKGIIRHEMEHARNNIQGRSDNENDVKRHDGQTEVWYYGMGNMAVRDDQLGSQTPECTAAYSAGPSREGEQGFDTGSSKCSGAFNSALDRCIFGTGPLPLTTFSEKSWCNWAICDEWGQDTGEGEVGGGPDIGGIAPGAKGPGYGLGGDTRDFDQYDRTNILCGETLLEMFGMIDCELSNEGAASSGGSNAGFCQRGTSVEQEETVQPQELVEDSRCGSVAVEFECAGVQLGTAKLLKGSTAQLLKITKGTAIK